MKLGEILVEAIKQYDIDELITRIRNNQYLYTEQGLRGPSTFESGKCYEFALALYNFLKSKGDQPELIFLVGNMKKAEASWYDTTEFDPTKEHPFHTIVKVRKFYYDINGKLGTKREIAAMWTKFRNKKLVGVSVEDVKKYITDSGLVDTLEKTFEANYK